MSNVYAQIGQRIVEILAAAEFSRIPEGTIKGDKVLKNSRWHNIENAENIKFHYDNLGDDLDEDIRMEGAKLKADQEGAGFEKYQRLNDEFTDKWEEHPDFEKITERMGW
jgi:hypothetical protein